MLMINVTQGKTVKVDGRVVIISKKGWALSSGREKTIPISQITSVEIKKPGLIWNGFIQFSVAGGKARDSSFTVSGGTRRAASDENSVVFYGKEAYRVALQIREYINRRV